MTYADGTTERQTFPAQIWIQNDTSVKRVFSATQEIVSFKLDPDEETADVDTSNNSWPKKEATKFENFKNKVKGYYFFLLHLTTPTNFVGVFFAFY